LISKAQFANFPVWLLRNSQNNNNTNVWCISVITSHHKRQKMFQ
jgi:hypothetical protein